MKIFLLGLCIALNAQPQRMLTLPTATQLSASEKATLQKLKNAWKNKDLEKLYSTISLVPPESKSKIVTHLSYLKTEVENLAAHHKNVTHLNAKSTAILYAAGLTASTTLAYCDNSMAAATFGIFFTIKTSMSLHTYWKSSCTQRLLHTIKGSLACQDSKDCIQSIKACKKNT